jgi:hypothetical protein
MEGTDMASIVEYEVVRDYLEVAADDPRIDDVQRLLNAVNDEVRKLTRRDFEGDEGGSYDEVYRLDGVREFTLKHVPVASITSIARVEFDGTEYPAYAANAWRLEDADRGRIRLLDDPDYVRVVWRTTGDIPVGMVQAVLDWCKARWDERTHLGLASQQIDNWSESYGTAGSAAVAGIPPHSVAIALMGAYHATGGGRV